MRRRGLRAIAALSLFIAAVFGFFGHAPAPAHADDSTATARVLSRGATLSVLTPASDPANGTWTLSVRLAAEDGEGAGGVPVRFFMLAPFFGGRLMDLGDVVTDASGIASLVYRPTWTGSHTAVIRFDGNETSGPLATTMQFESDMPVHFHEDASFGIDPVRRWLPVGAILAVLAVWGTLGYAAGSTIIGVYTGRDRTPWEEQLRAPTVEPAAFPGTSLLTRVLVSVIVLAVIAAIPIALLLPSRHGGEPAVQPSAPTDGGGAASDSILPATLVRSVETRIGGVYDRSRANSADLPADLALVRDRIFVLDTNNGRLMALSDDDILTPILESTADREIFFKGSTAVADHNGLLYVADSIQGQILKVTPQGKLDEVIKPQVPEGEEPLVPAGIAVTEGGDIWLSDAGNHRVFLLDRDGLFIGMIGAGAPSAGPDGFDTPGALALDQFGNVFVVDRMNHEIKKFSPLGTFLTRFGADVLKSPAGVVVDEAGRVFVSDTELVSVVAFADDGSYLGCVSSGECEPDDPDHRFQVPYGLKIYDGLLYVMDRLAGVLVFQVDSAGVR